MASTDNIEDNTKFAEQNDATFPILADPGKDMCKQFDVLSAMGYANRWTFYIDIDGNVARIDKTVSPRTAGADLVNNMKELGFATR